MQHHIKFNIEARFDALSTKKVILPPSTNSEFLDDVLVEISGKPSSMPQSFGSAPYDVRLYLSYNDLNNDLNNDNACIVDLTPCLLQALRESLDKQGNIAYLQYKEALELFVTFRKELGDAYPGGSINPSEFEQMKDVLRQRPLSQNLGQLGDRRIGWSGSMHIFNYIFDAISLGPVSLKGLIDKHNLSGRDIIGPEWLHRPQLTVAAGPLGGVQPFIGGVVSISCEYVYVNPNDKVIADISFSLEKQKKITESLQISIGLLAQQIDLLSNDSQANKTLVSAIEKELARLKDESEDQKTDLSSILNLCISMDSTLNGGQDPGSSGIISKVDQLGDQLNQTTKVSQSIQTSIDAINSIVLPSLRVSVDNIGRR